MSSLPNGTFATPGDAIFAVNGSQANFPNILVSTINNAAYPPVTVSLNSVSTSTLFVSSINNAAYPPASGPTVVYGKSTFAQGFGSTISVLGCLSTSTAIITPCITNGGEPNILLRATTGTNSLNVAFQNQVPGGTIINYAVFI